jgi:hypothetical protein
MSGKRSSFIGNSFTLLKQTFSEWLEDKVPQLAAALAFNELPKNDSDLAIDILLVFHSLHRRWKDGWQARLSRSWSFYGRRNFG